MVKIMLSSMRHYQVRNIATLLILGVSLAITGCRTTGSGSSSPTPLNVVSTTPANGNTGVNSYSSITVTFNSDIDPSSVNGTNFDTGGIVGTTTISGNVLTFTPSSPFPLADSTTYSFKLLGNTSGIKNLNGENLSSDYQWSFTTQAPADCASADILCVDDDVNPQQEYSSIQNAVNVAGPGQTVLVFDGNYAGFRASKSGTSTNRITIKASGNGAVINSVEPNGSGNSVLISNASYVTVDGFVVNHNGASGYAFAARNAGPTNPMHGLVISNNTVMNAASTNMYFSEVADSVIEGNTTYGSQTSHGIYLANGGSDNTIIRGNISYNNAKNGIHLNGDISVGGDGLHQNITIENNILYGNAQSGMDLDGIQDSLIQNNLVYGNARHCLRVFQIDAAAGPKNLKIVNNTFVAGTNGWAVKISEDGGGHVFFNNILFSGGSSQGAISVGSTAIASDRNAVTGVFSVNNETSTIGFSQWQSLGFGANSFTASPSSLFVNAGGDNYNLLGGVPAIDSGVPVFQTVSAPNRDISGTPRPQGSGFDLGAYEQ